MFPSRSLKPQPPAGAPSSPLHRAAAATTTDGTPHQAHLYLHSAGAPNSPSNHAAAATARPPHQAHLDLDAAGAPRSPSHDAAVASPSSTTVPSSSVIPTQDQH
ncbi:unnamed protein product [Urochloa humidicola]